MQLDFISNLLAKAIAVPGQTTYGTILLPRRRSVPTALRGQTHAPPPEGPTRATGPKPRSTYSPKEKKKNAKLLFVFPSGRRPSHETLQPRPMPSFLTNAHENVS
jgi:hypothetical protein